MKKELFEIKSLRDLETRLRLLSLLEKCNIDDDSITFRLVNNSNIEVYISKREEKEFCYLSVDLHINDHKRITFDNFEVEWNILSIVIEINECMKKISLIKGD